MKKILTLLLVGLVALWSCNQQQTPKAPPTTDSTNQKKADTAIAPFVDTPLVEEIEDSDFNHYQSKMDAILRKFDIKKSTRAVGFKVNTIAYWLTKLKHAGYDSVYIYFGGIDSSTGTVNTSRHLKITTILWKSPYIKADTAITPPPKPINTGQLYP